MINCKRRMISGALVILLLLTGWHVPTWLYGTEARVFAAAQPAPDLIIESVALSPVSPSIGDIVTFSVTIKNQGNSQVEDSYIAYVIDEQTLATNPVDPIDPGAVKVKTFTWKAKAGPHVFKAIIDPNNSVTESAKDNNYKTCVFSVLAPDLAIYSISWTPLIPSAGDKITFTVTIINKGDKRAGLFNIDFCIDGNSRGYHVIPAIEPGASVQDTYTWIAISGVHKVKAVADVLSQVTESDETNNDLEATCATSEPDLIISSITMSPENPAEGDPVTFTISVKNQGGGKAGPTGVTLYLDDSHLDWVFLESLNAGASTTVTYEWKYETKARAFKATVDVEDMVKESDETNNSKTYLLPQFLPDLVIQDIAWSPSSPILNETVSISIIVKNQGKGIAGVSDLDFYIDNAYLFHASIPDLAPGATNTVIFNWKPRLFSHVVKAIIDVNNLVQESDESNNTLMKTMTSIKRVPIIDLTIENISCSPAKPAIGETLTITVVVKNLGTGTASPSTTVIYIDNNLVDEVYTNEIDAGNTLTLDTTVSLKGLPFKDTYKVTAVANSTGTVFETSELNNQKEMLFSIAAPDLVIQSVNWSPEAPAGGDMVTFNVTVKNQGDLKSGSTYLSYYVEKVFMAKHRIENIEPGATVTRAYTCKAPKDFFLFAAIIDEAGEISEKDKSNNSRTVSVPAPDLLIDSISWAPGNPTEILLVTFTAIIRNRGYAPCAGTFLSRQFDGAAPIFLETGSINPGGTTAVFFTYSFAPGEHTLRLIADANDTIAESDETNNEKTVKFPVQTRSSSVPSTSANSSIKTVAPTPTTTAAVKTSPAPIQLNKTPTSIPSQNVTDNITAPRLKVQSVIQNKLFFIVSGVVVIGAIVVLLLLRNLRKKKKKK